MRAGGRAALAVGLVLAALGCGYRPLHAGSGAEASDDGGSALDPAAPFAVIGALPRAPSAAAAAAAESGARSELARAGVLASGAEASAGCSTIEIELLRIEEEAAGIALYTGTDAATDTATDAATDTATGTPLARGLRVTVTGRARLWPAGSLGTASPRGTTAPPPKRAPLRDTGDVRATLVLSRGQGDAAATSASRDDAARLAGKRLGERLARRILGLPDPADE